MSTFDKLQAFQEFDNIVEYLGEYYWISDELPPEDIKTEDAQIETEPIMSMRRNICFKVSDAPYSIEPIENTNFNGSFEDENGYLPDNTKRLYKIITNNKIVEDYILLTIHGRVCIRNSCIHCEHNEICTPNLMEVTDWKGYAIVAMDIASQEPMILTFFCGEPVMLETFRNCHLRKENLLKYMDYLYGVYFKSDPNKVQSHLYWSWVDSKFTVDQKELLEFNKLVEDYLNGVQNDEELKAKVEEFMESINEFITNSEENKND